MTDSQVLHGWPRTVWRIWLPVIAGSFVLVRIVTLFGGPAAFDQIADLGWGVALIIAAHLVPLAADTIAWRILFLETGRLGWGQTLLLTWISQSLNRFVPSAGIGGEILRVRLATGRGLSLKIAAATSIADVTLAALSLLMFAVLGLVLLALFHLDGGRAAGFGAGHLAAGLVAMAAYFGFAVALFRGGMLRGLAGLFLRVHRSAAGDRLRPAVRWLLRTNRALMELARARLRLAAALGWRLVGWLGGAAEVWLALWLLRADQSAGTNMILASGVVHGVGVAIIIEALSQVIRNAAFFVPFGLGVQEAGIVAAAALVGVDPVTAVSIALLRRARELAIGVPAWGAWMWLERLPRLPADGARRPAS